jgi:hypothetical protein
VLDCVRRTAAEDKSQEDSHPLAFLLSFTDTPYGVFSTAFKLPNPLIFNESLAVYCQRIQNKLADYTVFESLESTVYLRIF